MLNRQIRALEHDLGGALLTRDRHGVALTDAGPLLASARAARRRVTVAARGSWSASGPASRSLRQYNRPVRGQPPAQVRPAAFLLVAHHVRVLEVRQDRGTPWVGGGRIAAGQREQAHSAVEV